MEKITFFVPGRPVPQGSLQAITSKTTGKTFMAYGKHVKPWRKEVAWEAQQVLRGQKIHGGCSMTLVFTFERPKCHYRTGKYSHLLRDDAPERHIQKPDPDKLERAILDALTGVAYGDDCEVYAVGKLKRWGPRGDGSGVQITMRGVFYAVREK